MVVTIIGGGICGASWRHHEQTARTVIQMSTSITNETTSPLLKEGEVAQILNLEVATLRRWRWSGRGPRYVKLGGAVRYDPTVLRSYLAERVRTSTSDPGNQGA